MPNRVRVDASDLRKVAKMAKEFDPALRRQLLRQLRAAGRIGADVAKEGIQQMPVKGTDDHGLRDMISKAVTVNVAATGKRADIRIRVRKTPALVEYGAPGIAKAINKGRWKHPVFAKKGSARYDDKKSWKTQPGKEFFDKPLKAQEPKIRLMVKQALDEARDIALGRGKL